MFLVIFSVCQKNRVFGVFLVHTPMASVLLSASVERCFVSRKGDFFLDNVVKLIGGGSVINGAYPV